VKLRALTVTTVVFVVVSLLIGGALYGRLPDPVPTHFSLHAQPDGFTAKPIAVLLTPLALGLLGMFFVVLPKLAPKGYRLDRFLRVYEIMAIAVLTVEFTDGMLGLGFALGYPLDMDRVGTVGLGVLLIVLGNFTAKVTRNFFVGIRTPWTLANPEVWLRTHRVGGPMFVIGGAVIVVNTLAGGPASVVAIAVILGIALFLTAFSYVLYRRIEARSAAGHH
jgi:uncharacterized membrane protein